MCAKVFRPPNRRSLLRRIEKPALETMISDGRSGIQSDADARVDQGMSDTKARAERYQAMRAEARQVSVAEQSRDGMITITMDSDRSMTDLRIIRPWEGRKLAR